MPLFVLLLIVLFRPSSSSSDILTASQSLKDGDVLVSEEGKFACGFFTPGNSGSRFLGIWYAEIPVQTVVWVANRENPLNDTSGVLSVDFQGNLVLRRGNGSTLLWSTNVSLPSVPSSSSPVVRLLDSGNLVLYENADENFIRWQSFDYPTNIHLPYMKFGMNRTSSFSWSFTSWRSYDDPRPGNCTYKIDTAGYPQAVIYKDGRPYFRVGSWTGSRWSGLAKMDPSYIFQVNFTNNEDEVSFTFRIINESFTVMLELNETGTIQPLNWVNDSQRWVPLYTGPNNPCDYYNQCGPNSNCDPDVNNMCSCLPGFEPKSPTNWYLRDTTDGCIRKNGNSICHSGEGFLKIPNLKTPDTSIAIVDLSLSLTECEQACLNNCSCVAYASANDIGAGSGCLMWHGDLNDSRKFSGAGQDLYLRVDAAELGRHSKNKIQVIMPVLAALLLLLVSFALVIKRRRDLKHTKELDRTGKPYSALPCFDLNLIVTATDNFSIVNRLGQGGFGTVYKGVMSDGTEIAVKRLSELSGQGDAEFRNEINLIAKLQHRNLVKMLGFCLQDNEKILVYEYLPNRSLDIFLFDESKKSVLDWRKRFDIAMGIARGLMYLHQDSRLKIIHRDLKASNILLDETMDPKIADFGMAKMCCRDQNEGKTRRVVGTYGYMSPEYAMGGLFSVKSDVYSFGVLLLEIISGRKVSSYYDKDSFTGLVGHVWKLWGEGRSMEIVDESIELKDARSREEVSRCLQIGLLCVQQLATERPTMSSVVFMMGNGLLLPLPSQPAYVLRGDDSMSGNNICIGPDLYTIPASVNEITTSTVKGR
ncbi:hypothetical protein MLD38_012125 [Melastoma candidum]|uniref:Uncharacterized protein n=1 Tax=Melastoma candidum TaxID=119954 RepID=A0ACB9R6L3_9MYRT|nr:hypothetical protein MLD38_012125 [Melastoma candidum]